MFKTKTEIQVVFERWPEVYWKVIFYYPGFHAIHHRIAHSIGTLLFIARFISI